MQIGRLVVAVVVLGLAAGAIAMLASRGEDRPHDAGISQQDPRTDPGVAIGPGSDPVRHVDGAGDPAGVHQDPVRKPIRDDFGDLLAALRGDGAIAGFVRSESGEAVTGALVWLIHPTDDDEVLDQRTTDAHGRFLFPIGIDSEEYTSFRLAAHDAARGLGAALVVAVPKKGELTLVELRASYPFGTIAGRVLGPGGRPVPDHPVMLVRIDPTAATPEWRSGRDDCEVRTGPDGGFLARGLRPGRFEVDADPRDEPAGELGERPQERPEATTDGPMVTIQLPWVRVDVIATSIDDKEQQADGFGLHVYAEPMAQLAAARYAAGQALAPPEVVATADRDLRVSGSRGSFWVVPGCFVVAEIDDGPRRAQAATWVQRDVAVQEIRVGRASAALGKLTLHVSSDDGTPIGTVLARLTGTNEIPFVPPGLEDLGGGFVRVEQGRPLELPPSNYRVQLLADPSWTVIRPLPDAMLPLGFDIAIGPGAAVQQRAQFVHGASIEFEIVCDPSKLTGAEPDRFSGRVGTLPIARANAVLWRDDTNLEPLLLGVAASDGPQRYAEVAGLPWQPGAMTHARALVCVAPRRTQLSVTSWRTADEDADGAHWPVELVRGVNRFRLRIDADLVVHFLGR